MTVYLTLFLYCYNNIMSLFLVYLYLLNTTQKMKSLYLIPIAIFSGITLFAQTTEINPIDSMYYACLENPDNYSTAGSIQCADRAFYEWSLEMEKNLVLLKEVLNETEFVLLTESQQHWYAFQNSETTFSDTMHANMDGTMFQIFAADIRVQIVRHRALALRDYYDTKSIK